jgi:pSer/pThr/pTyr-binding forkhead associated (FHA) protein/PAS domain-containing protein
MWTLRFLNGKRIGESIELKTPRTLIGRDKKCAICILDSGISKKHAEILVDAGHIRVRDLGSSNGTYVNGNRVQEQEIHIGDKISFYQTIVEFGLSQKSIDLSKKEVMALPQDISSPRGSQKVPQRMSAHQSHNPNIVVIEDLVSKEKDRDKSLERFSQNQFSSPMPLNSFPLESYDQSLIPYNQNSPPFHSEGKPFTENITEKEKESKSLIERIESPDNLIETAAEFIDNKIMPNVFSMTEQLSFKSIFLGIMVIFLLTVTVLSVIPLYIVTNESVKNEAFLRALSVARSVAQSNEMKFRSGDLQKFSTELLFQEKGIQDIYVIGRDGVILAPMEQSGVLPKHVTFARLVRSQPREFVIEQGGQILAAVPIIGFDPEQQMNIARAHVVVSYSSETLKFDDNRLFSLLVQVLLIGLLVGGLLFYILYKLVEYLFREVYTKLDSAIRSGADQITIAFNFPIAQDLLTVINSLLSRSQAAQVQGKTQPLDRINEYRNICNMIPYPTLIIKADRIIQYVNPAFYELMNLSGDSLENRSILDIPDQALQQNLTYLMDQSNINSHQTISDTLDMGGVLFSINCQAVHMASDEVDHFVLSISPFHGEDS